MTPAGSTPGISPQDRTVWAVIAGGGTSGHVHPALAIANAIVSDGRDRHEVHFIGSRRGLEAELVPEHGYELTALPGRGIVRSLSLQNLKSGAALLAATWQSLRTLRRLRPAVLVSVGGYASFPAVAAAVALRVPIVVAEQNTVAGAANRFASRWAKVCAVSFEDTDLPRSVHTGNPLAPEILAVDRSRDGEAAKRRLGVDPDRRLLVAFGGSLGARRINQAVVDATPHLQHRGDLAIRHLIGDRDWSQFGDHTVDGPLHYEPIRYERFMHDVWAAADLVICRAGATSVAEIAQTGTPAVFVPLPGAPGDHQTRNAHALVDHGGGRLVLDADLDAAQVLRLVNELMGDPIEREAMGRAARTKAKPDAAARIAELAASYARER